MREIGRRRLALLVLAHLILNLSAFSDGFCQEEDNKFRYEYGLSLLGGYGDEDGTDVEYYAAYPRWGWLFRNRWELEFEGNIGHYRFDSVDSTSLGLNGIVVYEFFRFDGGTAFLAGGGGLFYLDLDERPQLTDGSLLGLAQGGLGLRLQVGNETLLRLEYRFQHVSDPFETTDRGLNYHCLVLGISLMGN